MVSGTDTLHGMPIYYLPEGIFGITDLLEKSDAAGSVFGNYHYTVKEVKLAKNIKDNHLLPQNFPFFYYLLI